MRINHRRLNIERALAGVWSGPHGETGHLVVEVGLWTRHVLRPKQIARPTLERLDLEFSVRYRWCAREWYAALQEVAVRLELEQDGWWRRAIEHTPSRSALYPSASIGASPFLPLDRFAEAHQWSYDRESDTLGCWLRSSDQRRLSSRELRPGLAALLDARGHTVGCSIANYLTDAGDSLPADPLALVVAFPGVAADWLSGLRRQEELGPAAAEQPSPRRHGRVAAVPR